MADENPAPSRAFRLTWAAYTVSMAGSALSAFAIPLLVLETTHSILRMGVVTTCSMLGHMFGTAVGGVVVDRTDHRRLMIGMDLTRFLVFGALPCAVYFVPLSTALLAGCVALVAVFTSVFNLAVLAAIRGIVAEKDLMRATARIQLSDSVCIVVGPLLAGVFCQRFGPLLTLGVDALTFLASAVVLSVARFAPSPAGHESQAGVWAGLSFVARSPVLRATLVLNALMLVAQVSVRNLLMFRVRRELGHPADTVGLILGLGALGGVLAPFVAGPLRRRFGFGPVYLGPLLVQGLSLAAAGFVSGIPWLTGLTWLFVLGGTIAFICITALRQELTPHGLVGRVTSVAFFVERIACAAGATLTTWVAARIGAGLDFAVIGASLLVLFGASLFTGARARFPGGAVDLPSSDPPS